ncbi:MAG: hypothetical protein ACI4RG_08425, partial [Huintestinicola sp.]
MEIYEFHSKMKQHCNKLSGDCSQCCFIDYCYSSKMDICDEFLAQIVTALSENEDNDTGKGAPVIHNHCNVLTIP